MSLLDCSVALLANQSTYFLTTAENPPRMGNAHAQVAPYGVFPVSDGHVILAPANDRLFGKLVTLLGRPDLASDPRFTSNGDRVEHASALDVEIAKATAKRTKAELLESCAESGVPAGPINQLEEVFADPQVIARGLRIDLGGVPGVRSPFTFSDAEMALDRPSPILGEDSHTPSS
jgi:crotonobetainyl-CoA:carnitine CoA-transferase CaiB-like acyl-CoA transferase